MSTILKVFTPEQLRTLAQNKILAANVGLTNWNEGSRVRTLVEAFSELSSGQQFDIQNAIRKSIPIIFYTPFGFDRKPATNASGFTRLYRTPLAVIRYIGAGTNCLMSITPTQFLTTCAGAAGDNITFTLATYPTLQQLITAIDALPNYIAYVVRSGTTASTGLHNYSNVDVKPATNYLNAAGRDIMQAGTALVTIVAGIRYLIDGIQFETQASSSIAAGDATSAPIATEAMLPGKEGNISVQAIYSEAGKGTVVNLPSGAEYGINDSAFAGGQDQETDDERRTRFQVYVDGLARSTKRGIESGALSVPGVRSVSVRDNYPNQGVVTVICDDGSGNLSPTLQAEVELTLEGDPTDFVNKPGYVAAGVTVIVEPPVISGVTMTIVAYRIGTLSDSTTVINNIKTVVEQYINTRKLGDDVVLAEVIRRAKESHPAIFDLNITSPLANVQVNASSLARTAGIYGTINVNLVTLSSTP